MSIYLRPHEKHRMEVTALEMLNSSAGTDIRLEWITESGGAAYPPFDETTGATITYHNNTVRALVLPTSRQRINQISDLLSTEEIRQFQFDPKLNLASRDNLTFYLVMKNTGEVGSGTGSDLVWTPDTDPEWTVNEWQGFHVIIGTDDYKWKVLSNDSESLTLEENQHTLPESGEYEILSLQPWYPLRDKSSAEEGMPAYLMGEHVRFQIFYASNNPMRGRQ